MDSLLIITVFLFVGGLLGGFLSGLLGIGGGVVYVFILTQAYKQIDGVGNDLGHLVIANSLFVIFISTFSATLFFKKQKEVYLKETLKIGVPCIITSVLLTVLVINQPFFTPIVFNVITLTVLVFILVKTLLRIRNKSVVVVQPRDLTNNAFVISGILAGALSAVTGLGGGTILTPILNGKFKLGMQKVRSISLGVIMISSLAVTIFNLFLTPEVNQGSYSVGYINIPFCFMLGVGAMITSPLGVKTGNQLTTLTILKAFSFFIFLLIAKAALKLLL